MKRFWKFPLEDIGKLYATWGYISHVCRLKKLKLSHLSLIWRIFVLLETILYININK